jgi:hypothetical protein
MFRTTTIKNQRNNENREQSSYLWQQKSEVLEGGTGMQASPHINFSEDRSKKKMGNPIPSIGLQ